jgi:hypothetical protein
MQAAFFSNWRCVDGERSLPKAGTFTAQISLNDAYWFFDTHLLLLKSLACPSMESPISIDGDENNDQINRASHRDAALISA